MKASDLPHSTMTAFIEKKIEDRLEEAYEERAVLTGRKVEDVEKCPQLSLRQVSVLDKMHTVRDGVLERYKHKSYPPEFPCRTKCVVLFQNIDGQDVILFGMYVYEYGWQCPQPNQRRVYISYLDSVHYFRPRQYRTIVYQEIIASYLEYVKSRGFHTAHIWACPPLKGDDYILYCHPQDQKTPRDDRLRHWYDDILKLCQERGVVHELSDLYSEFLSNPENDATVLPYFEGDYWVSEAEVIIRDLHGKKGALIGGSAAAAAAAASSSTSSEGDVPADVNEEEEATEGNKSKRKKSKAANSRTRATNKAPLVGQKSERDPVMAKLSAIIEPMKEAFFVARLFPKELVDECSRQREAEMEASAKNFDPESEQKRAKMLQDEALSEEATDESTTEGGGGKSGKMSKKPAEQSTGGESKEISSGDSSSSGTSAEGMPSGSDGTGSGEISGCETAVKVESVKVETAVKVEDETVMCGSCSSDGGESTTNPAITAATQSNSSSGESSSERSGAVATPMEVETSGVETSGVETGEKTASSDTRAESKEASGDIVKREGDSGEPSQASTDAETVKSEAGGSDTILNDTRDTTTVDGDNEKVTGESTDKVQADAAVTADGAKVKAEENAEGSSEVPCPAKRLPRVCNITTISRDTEDTDDIQENEFFDTRQLFLNLCQGNHYQFDQLRRAKHTSMMVLYHLHNPDAPKFVPNCQVCHADILVGYRHRCEACDYDFCTACVQRTGNTIHQHPLRPMQVSATAAPKQLTDEQRKERQRSIELHLQLLWHASSCSQKECKSKNCIKMRDFLRHGITCEKNQKGGCAICKRIGNLLTLHARSCRADKCPVPKCREIREQIRQMQMRQQQMDDRRR